MQCDPHSQRHDWRTWEYTDGSCLIQNGKHKIGAGVYCPLIDSKTYVEPNGAGFTNAMYQAKTAAIIAAITHHCAQIASDTFTSFHQINKQLINPEKYKKHIKGDEVEIVSISAAQTHTLTMKSHAGTAGNERADAVATYRADRAKKRMADTGISSAGSCGDPFSNLFWLALEEKRELTAGTSTAPAFNPKIIYLRRKRARVTREKGLSQDV
eukprot:1157201-Pelagomonas_calceolata.AAC.1